MRTHRQLIVSGVAGLLALGFSPRTNADVVQQQIDQARGLFKSKDYDKAAKAFEQLRSELPPEQRSLGAALEYNRACALLAAGQLDAAEKSFLDADSAAEEAPLRASARYNLGGIAVKRADAEKDPTKVFEQLRRAERHFRNALDDHPGDQDARRNIEIVQRRLAKFSAEKPPPQGQDKQDQQKQDPKKQDPKNEDQQKQNQGEKEKQKDGEEQKSDEQKKLDQRSQDQQGQQGPPRPEETAQEKSEQKKDAQGQPEPKEGEKPSDQKVQPGDEQKKEGKDDKADKAVQVAPPTAQEKREFDRQAAEILQQERKQQERKRLMMKRYRQQLPPVEKDW